MNGMQKHATGAVSFSRLSGGAYRIGRNVIVPRLTGWSAGTNVTESEDQSRAEQNDSRARTSVSAATSTYGHPQAF